jgi:hypothetical protein
VKYWELIARNLKKAGWSLGGVAAVGSRIPLIRLTLKGTIHRVKNETRVKHRGSSINMKTLSLITAALFLVFAAIVSNAAPVQRISDETGVPVDTLQAERTSTGLGWGELETAHLLSNATGQSFDDIVALHQGGEGWGKIARDNGLKLGDVVSAAHRSSQAASHAQNTGTVHGKRTSTHGKSTGTHSKSTSTHGKSTGTHGKSTSVHGKSGSGRGHTMTMGSVRRGPSVKSGRGGFHGMGHGHGGH